MALTALYKCSKVSGKGDLKYSSRANNKSGFQFSQLLHNVKSNGPVPCKYEETGAAYRSPLLLLLRPYDNPELERQILTSGWAGTNLLTEASCLVFTRFST